MDLYQQQQILHTCVNCSWERHTKRPNTISMIAQITQFLACRRHQKRVVYSLAVEFMQALLSPSHKFSKVKILVLRYCTDGSSSIKILHDMFQQLSNESNNISMLSVPCTYILASLKNQLIEEEDLISQQKGAKQLLPSKEHSFTTITIFARIYFLMSQYSSEACIKIADLIKKFFFKSGQSYSQPIPFHQDAVKPLFQMMKQLTQARDIFGAELVLDILLGFYHNLDPSINNPLSNDNMAIMYDLKAHFLQQNSVFSSQYRILALQANLANKQIRSRTVFFYLGPALKKKSRLRFLQRYKKYFPDYYDYAVVEILAQQNEHSERKIELFKRLEEAMRRDHKKEDEVFLYNLGKGMLEAGIFRIQNGCQYLKKALVGNNNWYIERQLADCCYMLGKFKEAQAYHQRAIEHEPLPLIRQHMTLRILFDLLASGERHQALKLYESLRCFGCNSAKYSLKAKIQVLMAQSRLGMTRLALKHAQLLLKELTQSETACWQVQIRIIQLISYDRLGQAEKSNEIIKQIGQIEYHNDCDPYVLTHQLYFLADLCFERGMLQAGRKFVLRLPRNYGRVLMGKAEEHLPCDIELLLMQT